jgi:hypothetical protein
MHIGLWSAPEWKTRRTIRISAEAERGNSGAAMCSIQLRVAIRLSGRALENCELRKGPEKHGRIGWSNPLAPAGAADGGGNG